MISEVTLTTDDEKRISKCKDYRRCKAILDTKEHNKDFEVGSAVSIKKRDSDSYLVGTSLYNPRNKAPTKFLIIKNEEGFVFAKRITASGQPGKEILCLTTDYPMDRWELIADDAMLDALLLDQDYNPLAEAKDLKKRKNKASRMNNKHRLNFSDHNDAYEYIKSLKPGDILWTAGTTFGDRIDQYQVSHIKNMKTDASKGQDRWSKESTYHRNHVDGKFAKVIIVELKLVAGHSKYSNKNKHVCFYNICKERPFSYYNMSLYTKKPITPGDL